MNRKLIEILQLPESFRVPILGGLWYKFLTKCDNNAIKKAKIKQPALNACSRDIYITASLTSFPARINYVYLAIKSLLLQSVKPDKLILWLAEEQFPNKVLPKELLQLTEYGLEIKWCEDLYGHKKYYYCIKDQKPNEVVITFDDDIIYPIDCIKRLIKQHKRFPNCIICERAQSIDYEKSGTIKNPGKWKVISNVGVKSPSYSLNPSPGGGCLIPYNAFYKDAIIKDKIYKLAYKNDDLWYMFMAAQQGTKIIKTKKYHKLFSLILGSQTTQMATENVIKNKNLQIMALLKESYPVAYNRIINDTDN